MQLCYSFVIRIYGLLLYSASFFNRKAEKWVTVRKHQTEVFPAAVQAESACCWIHCASAGEFEQAIPLIQGIRKRQPSLRIAVSFFSDSGMELYRNSTHADVYFYLPLDTVSHAKKIISALHPVFAVFIRNEIWLNLLTKLRNNNIPAYLINARSRPQSNLFYRFYLRQTYPLFTKLFYTDQTGDTKTERVKMIAEEVFRDKILEDFCKNSLVLIAGSSRNTEEALLALFHKNNGSAYPNLKIIVAPHEYDANKYTALSRLFSDGETPDRNELIAYSSYTPEKQAGILFLDKKGLLKYAYRYADIAFIGGGYNGNLHNISEAAVYGIPALLGPDFSKFQEAEELVRLGLAFPVNDYAEFEQQMKRLLTGEKIRDELKVRLKAYFAAKATASDAILDVILK